MTQSLHILVYDEESLTQSLLNEFAPIFNLTYSLQKSSDAVAQELASKKSNVLFFVEKENIEKFLSLLQTAKDQGIAVAFFAKTSTDAHAFRNLKEGHKVDYVLQQPIDKNEFAALLRKISTGEAAEGDQAYLTPELLNKYKEKIFEKIERIEELIKSTEKAADYKENLLQLRNEIHKITGNAAPYGFVDAGKLCGAHEVFLFNLYSGATVRELPEIVLQNEIFLRRLKLFFQKIVPRSPRVADSIVTDMTALKRRGTDEKKREFLIHLVTSNFDLARYFQSAAEKKHVHLEIEDNPDNYLANYESLTAIPAIVLVDEHFPFMKWNGIDLIKEIAAKQPGKVSLFGLMTDWDNLDKRVEWMKEGIDLIVKKPITEASVDYVLNQALSNRNHKQAKVMIVDDDEEQGLLMKEILESINITVRYVSDASKLFPHLEEFNPDLLLLDIRMPKYSGKLLLSALRDDVRYKNLLIVIETALSSSEIDEWAYKAQCDAIIHKPLNIPVFLARISALLTRQREYFSPKEIDPLTGLMLWEPFVQRLEEFISQAPRETKCAFILLKIVRWESLISVLSQNEAQQILLLFSEFMKSHFFSSLFQGTYTQNCFGLLFKDLTGGELEFLLESFFEKIYSKIWLSSQTQLKIHSNAAIVLFVTGDVALSEVVDAGKEALKEAENIGVDKTVIKRLGDKIAQPKASKQLILVDDDLDLCDIIRFAFEKRGFSVQIFNNAKDALHFFAQLQSLASNSLIVLDRRLPDGDGIDILHKINDKFPGSIKAIFLSSLSNEKEILEALRSGALDYITKPFSIEVLIEKASILLSK